MSQTIINRDTRMAMERFLQRNTSSMNEKMDELRVVQGTDPIVYHQNVISNIMIEIKNFYRIIQQLVESSTDEAFQT